MNVSTDQSITLRAVYISKSSTHGGFEAVMRRDDQIPRTRTKQCQLSVRSPQLAYEIVDLWAEDMAKKTGLPYTKVSATKLLDNIKRGSGRNPKKPSVITRPTLTNETVFKADVKRCIAEEGYEKVKAVLTAGMELLEHIEGERVKIEQNSKTAKDAIARSMYQTFIDTGVDTTVYCNDDEIKNKFIELREAAENI